LSNSPWILGAPHNGLAMLSQISRRISKAQPVDRSDVSIASANTI
jgi:hypothetical protein